MYLSGDVWGYVINDGGKNEDSCWGFYGDDYCLSEAKSIVDCMIQRELKEKLAKVKNWIKNRVPLIHRHFEVI